MIKRFAFYLFFLTILPSCSVEKINLSPVADGLGDGKTSANPYSAFGEKTDQIVYSSEITSLISSFPKFRNDAVNKEVGTLKIFLKQYVTALDSYNINGMEQAYHKYEKSYKKLQNLRKYLNSDEDQVLNRYLVRIKTNMSFLENSKSFSTTEQN